MRHERIAAVVQVGTAVATVPPVRHRRPTAPPTPRKWCRTKRIMLRCFTVPAKEASMLHAKVVPPSNGWTRSETLEGNLVTKLFSLCSFVMCWYFGYRLLGLCLLQNELCPIFLTRHVLKSILGRPIRFHDLAFFDPVVYESLRQLVVDAETKDSNNLFSTLDLNFT